MFPTNTYISALQYIPICVQIRDIPLPWPSVYLLYINTESKLHYRDVMMCAMASLAFVWGIHRSPVNFPHKGTVPRKIFSFDDVIMAHGDAVGGNGSAAMAMATSLPPDFNGTAAGKQARRSAWHTSSFFLSWEVIMICKTVFVISCKYNHVWLKVVPYWKMLQMHLLEHAFTKCRLSGFVE